MRALPFIEAVKYIKVELNEEKQRLADYTQKVIELNEFYSQPFDIGMLVNPIEKPVREINPPDLEDNRRLTKIWKEKMEKWRKAEGKVLFKWTEGISANNILISNDGTHVRWHIDIREWDGNIKYRNIMNEDTMLFPIPETLNYFISDCCRAGVTLHWKQSIVDKYFNQTK